MLCLLQRPRFASFRGSGSSSSSWSRRARFFFVSFEKLSPGVGGRAAALEYILKDPVKLHPNQPSIPDSSHWKDPTESATRALWDNPMIDVMTHEMGW